MMPVGAVAAAPSGTAAQVVFQLLITSRLSDHCITKSVCQHKPIRYLYDFLINLVFLFVKQLLFSPIQSHLTCTVLLIYQVSMPYVFYEVSRSFFNP